MCTARRGYSVVKRTEVFMIRGICVGLLLVLLVCVTIPTKTARQSAAAEKTNKHTRTSCPVTPPDKLAPTSEGSSVFQGSISQRCWPLAGWHGRVYAWWTWVNRTGWLSRHEVPLVERRGTPRQTENPRQKARCTSAAAAGLHSRRLQRHRIPVHCADFSDRGMLGSYWRSG